jgi:hypothetical protein
MKELNLPQGKLKLSRKDEVVFVFCEIRKKKLVCTPEEWVRQHFMHFLMNQVGISRGKILSELPIKYNSMNRRSDIVVIDERGAPEILIECKAPEIPITQKTLQQIAQYNSSLQVKLMVMTNGLHHVIIDFQGDKPELSTNIDELKSRYGK